MDDGAGKINFIPDYFQVPASVAKSPENRTPLITEPGTNKYLRSRQHLWGQRTMRAASMLRLFSLRGLPWLGNGGQEKVELTAAEVESLRSELADMEEREAQLKAQLENIDEILRSSRLSGYLYIRSVLTAKNCISLLCVDLYLTILFTFKFSTNLLSFFPLYRGGQHYQENLHL